MALKISPQLASLIEFLKGKDTTPEMWADLHNVSPHTAREYLRRGRENDEEARYYHAKWNSLLANPRLRRWLKRPEDYTTEQEEADRRRQKLLDERGSTISRTKRQPNSRSRERTTQARKRLSRHGQRRDRS